MKRFLLAPLIFFVSCNPAFAQTQTFWGNVNIEGSLDVIISATITQILTANGSVSAPSVSFTNDTKSGLYLTTSGELDVAAGGVQAIDIYKFNSSQVNFGFNTAASQASAANPVSFAGTFNGLQFYQYGNLSTGTSSGTSFQILDGTPSSTVSLNLENRAYQTSGYLAGATDIYAGSSVGPLMLISNAWTTSPNITFGLGGIASSNAYMALTEGALTLNQGNALVLDGSSSGAVTIGAQAAAGTYNFNLPTTAGSSGQPLLSGGGSSSPMTFGTLGVAGGGTGDASFTAYAPIAGGATTTGALQSLGSGMSTSGFVLTSNGTSAAPTWQAPGSPTFSGLTQYAPIYATTTSTVASISSLGTVGQVLTTNGSSAPSYLTVPFMRNLLYNSSGLYWQRGTSCTNTTTGAATWVYCADRWAFSNDLGATAVVTEAQTTPANSGSAFGIKATVTTAPSSAINTAFGIYQALDIGDSDSLYQQTVSFSVLIKAQGNVNSVQLALGYSNSTPVSANLTNSSTTSCSVSNSGWTNCSLTNATLSSSLTQNTGFYVLSVTVNGVSSGHYSDISNGFIVEQPYMVVGKSLPNFVGPLSEELQRVQRYYEKSYSQATALATTTLIGMAITGTAGAGVYMAATIPFKATKRAVPTMSYWDLAGNATKYSTLSGGAWAQVNNVGALTEITPSDEGFIFRASMTSLAGAIQWQADAEIY